MSLSADEYISRVFSLIDELENESLLCDDELEQIRTLENYDKENDPPCVNKINGTGNLSISRTNENIKKAELLLNQLKDETNEIEKEIQTKNKRIFELRSNIESIQNNQLINSSTDLAMSKDELLKLDKIKNDTLRIEVIKSGLESLIGIKINEIKETESNGISMDVVVKRCEASVSLGVEGQVVDLHITAWPSNLQPTPNTQQILRNIQSLPTPQDLRMLLFTLKSIQDHEESLQRELVTLRKQCLVKVLETKVIQLTFRNGLSAVVLIHELYPNIPSGVYLKNLLGIGGWNNNDLANLELTMRSKCHSSIVDLVKNIVSELGENEF